MSTSVLGMLIIWFFMLLTFGFYIWIEYMNSKVRRDVHERAAKLTQEQREIIELIERDLEKFS